jgi:hypothetical protein
MNILGMFVIDLAEAGASAPVLLYEYYMPFPKIFIVMEKKRLDYGKY